MRQRSFGCSSTRGVLRMRLRTASLRSTLRVSGRPRKSSTSWLRVEPTNTRWINMGEDPSTLHSSERTYSAWSAQRLFDSRSRAASLSPSQASVDTQLGEPAPTSVSACGLQVHPSHNPHHTCCNLQVPAPSCVSLFRPRAISKRVAIPLGRTTGEVVTRQRVETETLRRVLHVSAPESERFRSDIAPTQRAAGPERRCR